MIRWIATFALLLSACAPAPSRIDPHAFPMLAHAGLLADVDVLEHAYETLHPGLYRYNTPAQLDAHFADLRRAFDHDQSLGAAYLAFSRFAATIRCGHTYANFFNQPKAIQKALFEDANRVPFHFRWIDGRMIVTRSFTGDLTLAPGTEVVSINGIGAASMLKEMLAIARADGSNDAKRVAWLQVQGEDSYEAFDIFLPLFHPQIGATQSLVIREPGRPGTRTVRVAALTYEQRLAARPAKTDVEGPLWTLDTSHADHAVLRMPTWALYNSHWDWKAFLQSTFETLASRNIPALVIDLRGNEGGIDAGNGILSHLIDRDLHLPGYRRLVRYRQVPADLAPYLDTWDPSFRDWGNDAIPFDDRYYRLTRYDDAADGIVIRPETPRYHGRVFVLVGATNSSATFEFALAVQQAKLGELVGQSTGGNRRGINGGAFFFLRLPNSGIELDLPLIGQFPLSEQPDSGLDPDVPVTPSVADIGAGRDAEMAAVLARLAVPH